MTVLVPYESMLSEFIRILSKHGFSSGRAADCARIFATNSLEGIYSHGVNRFARFVKNVMEGIVIPQATPSLIHKYGSLEQWNGNLGPGPLNAVAATNRAVEIAMESGIGLVAMAETNHWMRGGTYGWQAARKGFVFIGWTNTEANMPAWGAKDARLGNNPLVFAIPYENEAVVLDFAMSLYSYGKMESYALEGKKLPFPGGFDAEGCITDEPERILETRRTLPAGYWKGSGLSMVLDILAAVLSAGLPTYRITARNSEYALSQVFIAINIRDLINNHSIGTTIDGIINDIKGSFPAADKGKVRYPGENVVATRELNLVQGIPVNDSVWNSVLKL